MYDGCLTFFKASVYGGTALSNDSQSHDNWAILLLIMQNSCVVTEGR